MKSTIKHIFLLLFLITTSSIMGQSKLQVRGDKARGANDICKGCILITGNVHFKSKGSVIKCDRAVQNKKSNTVEATGNVRIFREGNPHPLHGDVLYFDGNTNLARLRNNVYYDDGNVSFTTEKFNFNTATEEGYYFDGGIIKDSVNTLVSQRGYIYKNNDMVVKDSVTITTPDYLIVADSLMYNSDKQTVYIIAPTTMYSDSSTLYAEDGYYQTDISYAFLTHNAQMEQGSYTIIGDTLSYNETSQIGEGWGNLRMEDTVQMVILKGNYMYHDDSIDYSYIADSAQLLMYSGFDTLFAHADTLFNFLDTAEVQFITGYPNVRFFRLDIQGKCDSFAYNMDTEVATMFYQPMMWALYNQMSGDVIHIYSQDNHVSHVELIDNAFLISREDSIRFNQVKGRKITGYISNNDLRKVDVDGQAQSIYYSRDGMDLVGYNQSESNYLTIFLKDGLVTKLALKPSAIGNFYSLESNPYEEQFLKGFQWRSDLRPISPWDIFRRTPPEINKKKKNRIKPKR